MEEDNEEDILSIDYSIVSSSTEVVGIEDEEVPESDTLKKSISVVRSAYKDFGEKLNLDSTFDVESVLSTFESIVDTQKEAIFNSMMSKVASKVKLSIYSKLLLSLPVLTDRITSAKVLESNNIELSLKLIERVLSLVDTINALYNEVSVKDADIVLNQLATEIDYSEELDSNPSDKSDADKKRDTILLLKRLRGH